MQSTTRYEPFPTITQQGSEGAKSDPKLIEGYERLTKRGKVSWTGHHHMMRLLGRGGQGEVYLTEHRGTDGFTVPVAMKVFSPERYAGAQAYTEAMARVASIAARVALIQHDNLLDVQNFFERDRIRIMMMEFGMGTLTGKSFPLALRQLAGKRAEFVGWWSIASAMFITAGSF